MDDRTVNIMLIAKRCGSVESMKRNIAKYMSEECACPIEVYDDRILYSIVKNAFLDFCRSAATIHAVSAMRNFFELDGSDLDRMILSLGLAQVASRDISGSVFYINGWHDTEFTEKVDKGEWGSWNDR